MKNKIYAFIDSNNLYQGVKTDIPELNYRGWKIDFKKLKIYLTNKYSVDQIFIFIGFLKSNEKIYNNLKALGYLLIFKPTILYKDFKGKRIIKGNVDAELVLQAMIELNNYDKAVIIAGDGDYRCLIEYLESKNKLGYIFIPNQKRYSSLLTPFMKYIRYINPLKKKLQKNRGVACSI